MADIFISYKSERRPAARHLKKVLDCYFRDGGEECVWYDYGLIPGDDFEPHIMAEIQKAKVALVLWCEMGVKSEWVRREAREAKEQRKFLPCRIQSCQLPDEFSGADTLNLSEWDGSPRAMILDRLLDEVGRRIGREAVSRISRLRELEEDWRGYGAPTLAHFALGEILIPDSQRRQPKQNVSMATSLGPSPSRLSPNLAHHWSKAQDGDAAALSEIAYAYHYGLGGLSKNDREAARLYRVAADLGHPEAWSGLGVMNALGLGGFAKNDHEAVRLYKLAADKGDARGQNNLGIMHEQGRGGLPKDDREAVRFYKLAADQGDPRGQRNLGVMCEEGRGGLPQDQTEATRLYKLAAEQGDEWARNALARLKNSR